MKTVGLTGGIASGKSTVAGILRSRGVPVIDADAVAREIVAPGQPALVRIVERFGPTVLGPDGTLDRAAMRKRITSDPEARRALEAITHPEILRTILERLSALAAEGTPAAVVEAALMVETGSYRNYPLVVVVTCDPALQLQRVMARDGVNEADARAIVATQLPLAEKERAATHLIRNDSTLAELEARVEQVWDQILST